MGINTFTDCLEVTKYVMELFKSTDNNEKTLSKVEQEIILRNYYAEILYDKRILEAINFNSGIDKNKLDALRTIMPLIKNDYSKILIVSFGFLDKYIKAIHEQNIIIDSANEDKPIKKDMQRSLEKNIIYVSNRIETLKGLAQIDNLEYLKQIKIATRLKNIKICVDQICKELDFSFENIMHYAYV